MVRSRVCPNIMQDLRSKLKSSLMSGKVIQVCGPPMAGKSNLVDQVTAPNGHLDGLIYHSFSCKRLSRLDAVLEKVITTLQPSGTWSPQASTETRVLYEVQKCLVRFSTYHHVFGFHKCESLRSSGADLEFVSFLSKLDKLGWSENVACSVVFTTYKKFSNSGLSTEMVQVGFLTDPIDIKSLLELHAPGVDVIDYIGICQKLLCVPEAVIRFAEEYLVDDVTRCSPQQLEKRVCVDTEFLSMIFEKRVTDVAGWLSKSDLELLVYFGNSINSTFTEQNLIEFLRRQISVYHFDQWVALLLRRLRENHVLRPVPGKRLAVHPLLVYYVMTCRSVSGRTINDNSCNR
ncbi:unnamed protein product [Lymnaea stagnalis]|uniref:Uncharacterized protein n=1 Tax=Lymnaea stagnalis TaxID=6523 RepID=A0AAV2IEQ5_LYMST